MPRTCQDVLDRVRETLNDRAGTRYLTDELMSHLNDAIQQARSVRPDLFIGVYAAPIETPAPTDPFPLPDRLFNAVCYFVIGNAELRDDEFAVDGRAMTLKESYNKKLISGM